VSPGRLCKKPKKTKKITAFASSHGIDRTKAMAFANSKKVAEGAEAEAKAAMWQKQWQKQQKQGQKHQW